MALLGNRLVPDRDVSGGGAWGAGATALPGGGRSEQRAPARGQFTPVVSPSTDSL